MRQACIDCSNIRGHSYNPDYIYCDNLGYTKHSCFDTLERGIADKDPTIYVCKKYNPNYGPPYILEILKPLKNRGDLLGKVINHYISEVPNPYFVLNSGNLLKIHDSEDGILDGTISCALSDWMPMCSKSFKKPIIWLTLTLIKNCFMIEEKTFYYIQTPHTVDRTRLNYELAIFLLSTTLILDGKCKDHLEQILLGKKEYI
jgi:hypothetical protein